MKLILMYNFFVRHNTTLLGSGTKKTDTSALILGSILNSKVTKKNYQKKMWKMYH